jgi:hypothetical protein
VQDHHHPLLGLQDEPGLRCEERGGEVVARAKMSNNFVWIGYHLIGYLFLCFQANLNILLHYVGFYLGPRPLIDYIRKIMAAL